VGEGAYVKRQVALTRAGGGGGQLSPLNSALKRDHSVIKVQSATVRELCTLLQTLGRHIFVPPSCLSCRSGSDGVYKYQSGLSLSLVVIEISEVVILLLARNVPKTTATNHIVVYFSAIRSRLFSSKALEGGRKQHFVSGERIRVRIRMAANSRSVPWRTSSHTNY